MHSEGYSVMDEENPDDQAGRSEARTRVIPNTKRYEAVTLHVVQYYRVDSQ